MSLLLDLSVRMKQSVPNKCVLETAWRHSGGARSEMRTEDMDITKVSFDR